MIKKRLVLSFTLLMAACSMTLASGAKTMIRNSSVSAGTYSPQVCQFSLTKYSGTIAGGVTAPFKVGLSCPQDEDVRATVVVVIDDECVASRVVTVKAGKDYSNSVNISVGSSYDGKKYQLVVQ